MYEVRNREAAGPRDKYFAVYGIAERMGAVVPVVKYEMPVGEVHEQMQQLVGAQVFEPAESNVDLNCASSAVSNVRVESIRRLVGWSADIIGGACENLPDSIVVTEKPRTGCVATSQLQKNEPAGIAWSLSGFARLDPVHSEESRDTIP